jgi:antitoxin HicB
MPCISQVEPSLPTKGHASVALPAMVTSKVFLSSVMIFHGVRKAELARRMAVHKPQVDRLLNVRHASRIEQVESALQQLGRRLDVSIA